MAACCDYDHQKKPGQDGHHDHSHDYNHDHDHAHHHDHADASCCSPAPIALAGLGTMWMAVFADVGASLLVVGNGLRLLRK